MNTEMHDGFRNKLIVSCQAPRGTALGEARTIAALARAAVESGAAGIRADGAENIKAIRSAVAVPVIGIAKRKHEDGGILITPTFESALELVAAGASLVALDCTARGQRHGALERLQRIKSELGVPVLADIATVEEARVAQEHGADFVLTTLRGYTPDTEHIVEFDPEFVGELVRSLRVPVIAEGRIATPRQAAAALEAGAYAVIVGTAITRPDIAVRRFIAGMERVSPKSGTCSIGVDLGATQTKFALAQSDGRLPWRASIATPALRGRGALLGHLREVVALCRSEAGERGLAAGAVGIATAGWVDPHEGNVIYATGNLPDWSGAEIRSELEGHAGLPVAVENDANAMAVAEKRFGLARLAENFLCLTLGTGVGGGCFIGGRLNRGANYLGNAFGHITIEHAGLPCTCGQRGCLEAYANAAALVRYAGDGCMTARDVVERAQAGDGAAKRALLTYAGYLARGLATLIHVIDPELIILSGGIAQDNRGLLVQVEEELGRLVIGGRHRRLRVVLSGIASYGGVIGAAAIAMDEFERRSCGGIA